MPNVPHQNRNQHGYEAPRFSMRPCVNCGAPQHGSTSGPRPSTITCACSTCGHKWVQESDQLIAATLATQGAAA